MPDYIDLHIHSDHSDGRQSPREIIDRGRQLGLKAMAITDHDTVSAYTEAQPHAADQGIELVPGVELSASQTDEDLHILGYLFQPDDDELLKTLEHFRHVRLERGRKMVERLSGLGMNLEYEEVLQLAGKAPVGRPHVAEALANRGFVASYDEAFDKYLFLGGPVYVPKAKLIPADAIALVHRAGGVAVLAHPGLTGCDELIEGLARSGLDGIEIYHPAHSASDRKKYRKMAERYRLLLGGGSDSHGRPGRYGNIGDEKVPYEYLAELKARRRRYE